jgi:hypothetical protein
MRIVISAVLACGFGVSVSEAQWLNYPTPGVPRLPNGKPNLTARPPRVGGHPDLSGVWQRREGEIYTTGIDIPYREWAADLVKQRTANGGKDDPTANCLPWGLPRIEAFSVQKITQTSNVTIVLYEYLTTFRQIFTDGRKLPVDPNPTWMGYSVGHWEGDTLVVETSGFNGKSWFESHGQPVTEAMHLTERFRRPDVGHLEIDAFFDDPKAYTRPWKASMHLELMPDSELIEYVCNENEKDLVHLNSK